MVTDATINIADLVEDVHNYIVHPPFLLSTPFQHLISGIANIVYGSVKYTTKTKGSEMDKSLMQLYQHFALGLSLAKKEEAAAILNDVKSDYLSQKNNPLSIPRQFRHQSEPLVLNDNIHKTHANVSGKNLLIQEELKLLITFNPDKNLTYSQVE